MAVPMTVGEALILVLLVAAWAGAACGLAGYLLGRRP